VAWSKRPAHARAFGHPVPLSGIGVKEPEGSPKFPSFPCADMPRSQTPVVPWTLAIARPGLLPSSAWKPSASHHVHFSGLNNTACLLATPGFVRPFAGRHAGSLLTRGLDFSQVGLEPYGSHPLGNNNQFHRFSPTPKVSSLPWRDQALVRR
jgi:hypothetical protein